MEPVEAAAEVLGWAILGGLFLLGAVEIRHWVGRSDREAGRPRPHYVSERELELTGEDYRVHAEPFFRKWSKRQEIVRGVCRGD